MQSAKYCARTKIGRSGLRDTQYAVDLRADAAALEVLTSAGVAVLSEESEFTGEFADDGLVS